VARAIIAYAAPDARLRLVARRLKLRGIAWLPGHTRVASEWHRYRGGSRGICARCASGARHREQVALRAAVARA